MREVRKIDVPSAGGTLEIELPPDADCIDVVWLGGLYGAQMLVESAMWTPKNNNEAKQWLRIAVLTVEPEATLFDPKKYGKPFDFFYVGNFVDREDDWGPNVYCVYTRRMGP